MSDEIAQARVAGSAEALLSERADRLARWIRENAPDIQNEQKHLDEGSRERAYWHYGYLIALKDVMNLLGLPADQRH